MFEVIAGVEAKAIRDGVEWFPENFMPILTKKVSLFDKNEVVLDPIGKLGCNQNDHVVGGAYEKAGYYGFRKGRWVLIVHASKVKYLD